MKLRRLTTVLLVSGAISLALTGHASASGGDYTVTGGSAGERAEVVRALEASTFDWDLVPAEVTIHVAPDTETYAAPGEIWIDAQLLDTGRFAWGIVQHEYAHQVDFFLFDDATRSRLNGLLHGVDWYGVASPHHLRGDERFASTLAWAYWPSPQSALRPDSNAGESAAMRPASFRALMTRLVGAPQTLGGLVPRHTLSLSAPRLRADAIALS
jgi:hypothetical protein